LNSLPKTLERELAAGPLSRRFFFVADDVSATWVEQNHSIWPIESHYRGSFRQMKSKIVELVSPARWMDYSDSSLRLGRKW
jgi:hypothetical protein